jgi:hypothetical protein
MEIAIGIVITLLVALLGLLLNHISQCSRFHERLAKMEAEMQSVKAEIGNHETGIRGNLHELRNQISPMFVDFQRRQER